MGKKLIKIIFAIAGLIVFIHLLSGRKSPPAHTEQTETTVKSQKTEKPAVESEPAAAAEIRNIDEVSADELRLRLFDEMPEEEFDLTPSTGDLLKMKRKNIKAY